MKKSEQPSCPRHVLARVRRLRTEKGLSQKAVALYLGIKQQTYSRRELGRSKMPISEYRRLAMLYDVSMDFITGASNIAGHYPRL